MFAPSHDAKAKLGARAKKAKTDNIPDRISRYFFMFFIIVVLGLED
jgi:hypothetical protein